MLEAQHPLRPWLALRIACCGIIQPRTFKALMTLSNFCHSFTPTIGGPGPEGRNRLAFGGQSADAPISKSKSRPVFSG
jgi:hypothetical protein